MTAATQSFAPEAVSADERARPRLLCASAQPGRIARLAAALATVGEVMLASTVAAQLVQEIASAAPALVFIDFDTPVEATMLVAEVHRAFPLLPVIALGSEAVGEIALAAMRAGARDLLDIEPRHATPEAMQIAALRALDMVSRIMAQASAMSAPARRGKLTVLLGARTGAGVSTLAANLSVLLQKRLGKRNQGAALLDLGLPAADSTLLLDTRSELHFHDAVHNLRRFDETFVHTAFARHASGLALMTLPADLAEMRTVSYAAAVKTLERLRAFFDHQVVDLGGFSNLEFVSHLIEAADTLWLVCDANIASAVSAASLCTALESARDAESTSHRKPELIVNKHDPACNLGPEALAARLGLPLVATLPARAQALVRAVNQGQLLGDTAPADPYVRAVDALAAQLAGEPVRASNDVAPASLARLSARLFKRA
ncbi:MULTISPECIES: fimbrial protein [unclassified Caballeronia]|jgi:pilus assembly protein CpaE|uniref:AAA family ATPase n=1 Tax=unclassified Caballeronia TaxID=2646786 RepID=UPI002029076E|nr:MULTISPECIES: fimbrial protein [unclassified Caballeronia]